MCWQSICWQTLNAKISYKPISVSISCMTKNRNNSRIVARWMRPWSMNPDPVKDESWKDVHKCPSQPEDILCNFFLRAQWIPFSASGPCAWRTDISTNRQVTVHTHRKRQKKLICYDREIGTNTIRWNISTAVHNNKNSVFIPNALCMLIW